MTISWLDVLKLSVPFVTAVVMIWIKAAVEKYLARRGMLRALEPLLKDELQTLPDAVEALVRIGDAARRGTLRLVSFDVTSLIAKYASDLSALDSARAYIYSDLVSSVELVNKGLSRLSLLIVERAKAAEADASGRLDRAVNGQARITAMDFVAFGESTLKTLKEMRPNLDGQTIDDLGRRVETAKSKANDWPTMPPKEAVAPATSPKTQPASAASS